MDIESNKTNYYYYCDRKRVKKANVGLLLNRVDILVTASTGNTEVLNAFFAWVFANKGFQTSGLRDSIHKGLPAVGKGYMSWHNSVLLTLKLW